MDGLLLEAGCRCPGEVTQEGESVVVYGEPNDFTPFNQLLEAMGLASLKRWQN